MKFLRTALAQSIFPLNVLLVFLTWFKDRLSVPPWLQVVGRIHPLLMHLPIGLLVLCMLMVLFRHHFKKKAFHNFLNFVLYFAAFTAALTAMMGLLLSREGGYNAEQLESHLYFGVGVSLLAAFLLWTTVYAFEKATLFYGLLAANAVVVTMAGHYGSILTHGDKYILEPLQKEATLAEVNDSTTLYMAAIHPILHAKCMGCHNDQKIKGDLNMASLEKILKGGKHGPIWVAGKTDSSHLIQRIHLPEEDDKHMPPSGKPQLSPAERDLLHIWIQHGANTSMAWTLFPKSDTLRILAEGRIHKPQPVNAVHYTFAPASPETIAKLNTPYCTVTPISLDQPALKADFFLSQAFDRKSLEALLQVKEQLVSLGLAKMPLTDADAGVITQFTNLEELNLNQTGITSALIPLLKGLTHLRSLSVSGTSMDLKSLEQAATLPAMKEVFAWNTKAPVEEEDRLRKQYPAISWNLGYPSTEILHLTPPILVNENLMLREQEPLTFKHNLPGTLIRYTLDGSEPDSVASPLYKEPIAIPQYTFVRTKAFKPGWYGSQSAEFYVFKQGLTPQSAELLSLPDKEYKGEGANTLINNKKGMADNFRDIAWLGYREKPMVAQFVMKESQQPKTITLSYSENFPSYVMPPAVVELWGGEDPANLKLIQKMTPVQPEANGPRVVKGITFQLAGAASHVYKLVAVPVARVPKWVSQKQEKGWVFVDEVIFN